MNAPSIRKFSSSLDPWCVFKKVYAGNRDCFFLDSHAYRPPNQRYSYIGWDPVLKITAGSRRFTVHQGRKSRSFSKAFFFPVLRKILRKNGMQKTAKPFFCGGIVGFLGYETAEWFETVRFRKKRSSGQPRILLGIFRKLIVYDHQRKQYYWIYSGSHRSGKVFTEYKLFFQKSADKKRLPFQLKEFRPELKKEQFVQMVRKAKRYIAAGDIYQANLSQRFLFNFQGSSLELYGRLRHINPSPFASFFKSGDLEIVSSSPERLVLKNENHCETQPIAGTRPRKAAGKTERCLENELRENAKENAEHLMLVDLERNDLARVCRWPTVRVLKMKAIEKYSHVLHLVSRIEGKLEEGKDALDVLKVMFPGGTITGCPKIRCMQIINELEPVERGIYTGSLGYIDFSGNADWNIIIRTLVLKKNKGVFQVGAGIVHDSNPAMEYEETLHKAEAMMHALVQASGIGSGNK